MLELETEAASADKTRHDSANEFYDRLPARENFEELARGRNYTSLPDDWMICAADITGSTKLIDAGQYKLVNTVGAAIISAQMNAANGRDFPFTFAGDGAAFAVPPESRESARNSLATVRRWAFDEFGIDLRAAMLTIADVRAAGYDVRVARFKTSNGAGYAMFEGGGLRHLEREMKAGRHDVAIATDGELPDLAGLSCRWTPMVAKNGIILSVIVSPVAKANPKALHRLYREILRLVERLDREGHPVPAAGPGYAWPPAGLDLEARATHGKASLFKRKMQLLGETFIAWMFFLFGLKAGGFDARHYTRVTGENADFRKIADGLMMTIDCDVATRERLAGMLEEERANGLIDFGLFEQDEAILTCIVPSITSDDHIHFVDGAAGGYTNAAAALASK